VPFFSSHAVGLVTVTGATYQVLATDETVVFGSGAGADSAWTLPLANGLGGQKQALYLVNDNATKTVTVGRSGGDNIRAGAANLTAVAVGPGQSVVLVSDGSSNWLLVPPSVSAGGLVLPKTSGIGIRLEPASPTFGWRDILGPLHIKSPGAADPTLAAYQGNISQYRFAVNNEMWFEFHVPHDYVPASDVFFHVHWSHNLATVTGGNVTFGWNVSYAKGHNQAVFPAEVNPTLVAAASTTQYQHLISEVQLSAASPGVAEIDSALIEPDGLFLARFYLSANAITVSGGGVPNPFVHFVDIHYQSTCLGTKQKAPNFYV
jgi:hypothetical protein